MQPYLVQRLLLALVVLVGVSLLVFVVTRLTPGDPARVLLGPRATEEQVAQLRTRYGLDEPIYLQYVRWLGRSVTGDFGAGRTAIAVDGRWRKDGPRLRHS